MELSTCRNPYDFSRPVSEPNLFVGRRKELEEIHYYLDQGTLNSRPTHLAIIGPRAAGKTSLLNIIEIDATNRGYCAVRIDLDESDTVTEMQFFFKLLDAVLFRTCESGAYGGIQGKTYQIYLDIVQTYEVPIDKLYCPLYFPVQFAKARSRSIDTPVADLAIKHDLEHIQAELKKPIALLFDECNVLAKNKPLLQKVRNIFMNLSGYMLVLTGTDTLFPLIDDVFSPMIRQFKKVSIGAFENREETEACIRVPLEKIGLPCAPTKIFDFDSDAVQEIHDLSGGRPYEIQLICHTLFRRVQMNQATEMEIDASVLEDIRRQLENAQDPGARPMMARLRSLTRRELEALSILCCADGHASLDQIWTVHYIFFGNARWTKESLTQALHILAAKEIVSAPHNVVLFTGDEFDRIYAKYVAQANSVRLSIDSGPLEHAIADSFFRVTRPGKGIRMRAAAGAPAERYDITRFAEAFARGQEQSYFEDSAEAAYLFYESCFESTDEDLPFVYFSVEISSISFLAVDCLIDQNATERWARLTNTLSECCTRARQLDSSAVVKTVNLRRPNLEELRDRVAASASPSVKRRLMDFHVTSMINSYLQDSKSPIALMHAYAADRFYIKGSPNASNNIGYVFLSHGILPEAKLYFERSLDDDQSGISKPLATYNLFVAALMEGDVVNARLLLGRAHELVVQLLETEHSEAPIENRADKCACLLVPSWTDGIVRFEEQKTVFLYTVIPAVLAEFCRAAELGDSPERSAQSS